MLSCSVMEGMKQGYICEGGGGQGGGSLILSEAIKSVP